MGIKFFLCLGFLLCAPLTQGFFLPTSMRKQPDCVRRAPHTTATFNGQQWIPNPLNSGGNPGYSNYKDYGQQQQYQQQVQQQQVQQQQQQQQQPQAQLHQQQQQQQFQQNPQQYDNGQNVQIQGGPKYDSLTYQVSSQQQQQQQLPYEGGGGGGGGGGGYGSYAQHNVQLVPCLCPVNKEMIEKQAQQFQQHSSVQISPTSPPFQMDNNNGGGVGGVQTVTGGGNSKKNS
ncbi:hypothetical protein Phum_PHUM425190 [Pediculus humanus corporis]|uniref:Uncharacterized protein n=1 Tax=Pediculus humanus subsp. corporis TaxID=121224 RepID=E0VT17_PEDHC|nr:uncharacterized protein Phum_PHUM425190 [Pediculus humanus corporis]EEB16523.1 hypothetical protein Phum_PHUM425190 [Pediculus humanus corporis]